MQAEIEVCGKNDTLKQEPMCKRVREGLVTGAIIVIAAILLRFFGPQMAGKNDTLFMRSNALYQISVWLFILGGTLFVLTFAFWLADGMLNGRNKKQSGDLEG